MSKVVKEAEEKNKKTEERRKALEAATMEIEKKFGRGSIMRFDEGAFEDIPVISTGNIQLDEAIGVWGYPRGRITEIYGQESCLDSNTHIAYEVRDKNGNHQNHKGGTIRRLYERFHGIKRNGRGFYQRKSTVDSEFFVPSVNDENKIFSNPVADVVFTGLKYCYHVRSVGGNEIVCTEDHKFFDGKEYKRLGDISEGDVVYVHRGERGRKNHKKFRYAEVFVKYHPNGRKKIVTANDRQGNKKYSYVRYRVRKSHLLVEADKNGLAYDKYIQYLNTLGKHEIDSFWIVPEDKCVHHIDSDHRNDVLSNLMLIDSSEHNKYHAKKNHNNLRFVAVDDRVESIVPVGYRETYDVKCFYPYNNYVADGFVVHNSGKTTLALHAIAEAQKVGGTAAFIDAEHALDPQYARNLGVSVEKLWISQPDNGEQALEIVETLTRSGGVDIIVVDSVAALTPLAEIEGEMGNSYMGLQARLMSQALRKLNGVIKNTNTVLIFINQIRMKIGVMFGNPETTTGGRALKFYASVRLEIRRIETIMKGQESVGNRVRVKVVKNKVAPPFRKAEISIVFGKGLDKYRSLVDSAVQKEIIQKSGSWYSFNEERIGQGADNVSKWLEDNSEKAEQIEMLIRKGKEKEE
jgi:protein RecA